MLKTAFQAKVVTVDYHSAFYLEPISVTIETAPNFSQMKSLLRYLIEQSDVQVKNTKLSEFKRYCYSEMREDLKIILKMLVKEGKLLRCYKSGKITVTRQNLLIKRITK